MEPNSTKQSWFIFPQSSLVWSKKNNLSSQSRMLKYSGLMTFLLLPAVLSHRQSHSPGQSCCKSPLYCIQSSNWLGVLCLSLVSLGGQSLVELTAVDHCETCQLMEPLRSVADRACWSQQLVQPKNATAKIYLAIVSGFVAPHSYPLP